MPRYAHMFVIIAENKGFDQMMGHPDLTPQLHKLAGEYGQATQFYAEDHPSEGNYVAMVGGDTFGIRDDDAFFCRPGMRNEFCEKSQRPNYVDHSIAARSLRTSSRRRASAGKPISRTCPRAGSLMPRWPTRDYPAKGTAQRDSMRPSIMASSISNRCATRPIRN